MKLLSVSQAAKILGKSPQQTNMDILRGKLPAQRVGNGWILKEEDVKKFKESKTISPAKENPTTSI